MKTLNDLYFENRKNLVYLGDQVGESAEKLDELFCGCLDLKDICLGTILELSIEWKVSVEDVFHALALTYDVKDGITAKLRKKLMEMRENKGIDHKKAAAAAGVEPYVYLLMEKGYLGLDGDHVEGIAKAMNVNPVIFYE